MKTISLQDAKRAGVARYFTGKPCKRGHLAERFVSDRACSKCRAIQSLARYHQNPEQWKMREKRWRTENADKKHEYVLNWQRANPDKIKQYNARQASKNPGAATVRVREWRRVHSDETRLHSVLYGSRRRAALLHRTPAWADLAAIEEVYRDAAEFRAAGLAVDVDHIIPLQGDVVSGLHVPNNLRVCLSSVNRSKSNSFEI